MARAAGENAVTGAWALHGGRLAKIVNHDPEYGRVQILYADDGVMNGSLAPADLAPASPPQVAEGEAILADPELPARRTAAWAAGGEAVAGAWALHRGRLGKVVGVLFDGVGICYADDAVWSYGLEPADVAPASPVQVVQGEAQLDALGARPSSQFERGPLSSQSGK